jgi:hypothetical protein
VLGDTYIHTYTYILILIHILIHIHTYIHTYTHTHTYLYGTGAGAGMGAGGAGMGGMGSMGAEMEAYMEGGGVGDKKEIEPLPPVDHSTIEYAPFRRCFYTEATDISAQSKEMAREYLGELKGGEGIVYKI